MAALYFEVDHGTEAWRKWRAGKINCSSFLAVMQTGRGTTWGEPALRYAHQVAVELITGEPLTEEISAPATDWGKKWEPVAREEYIAHTMNHVEKPGRVYYREGFFVSGGGDGLIRTDGGLEIKCPKDSRVHLETILNKQVPAHHIPQVQGYMWLTERDWWDFVSYDPRFPDASRMWIQKVPRVDAYILSLSNRIQAFQELVLDFARKAGYNGDPYKIEPPAQVGEEVAPVA